MMKLAGPVHSRRPAAGRFRSGCAIGAALSLAIATPAAAAGSAFQGRATRVTRGIQVTQTTGHDTVVINATQGIIDWTPTDTTGTGLINFLPAGGRVTYIGSGDYTILNRILPGNASRPIALSGTIESLDQAAGTRGGSIWFYSPGGIIAGPTAVFNVGSLLLTTSAITTAGAPGSETFDPASVHFAASPGSLSNISINPGAAVNALRNVALIAPKIVQGGAIRADGQVAYIAAESGMLTMPASGGLFSIAIDAGGGTTAGPAAINHYGSTTRLTNHRGAQGIPANHDIYVVAVAKNNVVSMLLGGTLDDSANVVAKSGDTVVLSAGYDLTNGKVATYQGGQVVATAPGNAASNIAATDTTFGSAVIGAATGNIALLASGGAITVARGASLNARGIATVHAASGGTVTGTSLAIQSLDATGLVGGTASVLADGGGRIMLAGALTVDADGGTRSPGVQVADGQSPDGIGGLATVKADAGTIDVGTFAISAGASAGNVDYSGTYGNAAAGSAVLLIRNGGSVTTTSGALYANADNESLAGDPDVTGLAATGGTASIQIDGGSLSVTNYVPSGFGFSSLTLQAEGIAGRVAHGSIGRGGTAVVQVKGGTLSVPEGISVDSTAYGGIAGVSGKGGSGYGGTSNVTIAAASDERQPSVGIGSLTLRSTGYGGSFNPDFGQGGPPGGDGYGGTVTVAISAGDASVSSFRLYADAHGGIGDDEGAPVAVGDGYGGRATLLATGGTTTSADVNVVTDASGGAAQGGTSQLLVNGARLTVAPETGRPAIFGLDGGVKLSADAISGAGDDAVTGRAGTGKPAIGGTAKLATFDNADYRASSTSVDAGATGGSGGGGLAATAAGGVGGTATGGTATLVAYGGMLASGTTTVSAEGTGGVGGPDTANVGSQGGTGYGGSAQAIATAGTIHAAALTVDARGLGGGAPTIDGVTTSIRYGGNGIGGFARINANHGTIASDGAIVLTVDGIGHDGTARGGDGTGGLGQIVAYNGGVVSTSAGVTETARGIGGHGTMPGHGRGGRLLYDNITVNATPGTLPPTSILTYDYSGTDG